ncbi:hypothetical protein [Paraburkholderia hospita]|uniref:hypothetical protein n=1 Tax=Paraburkholderia hospita TaxID=169430 RepID=UPI00131A1981|nr:hypothetical protein [Paraburkholderia hospita]BDC45218.1 hypothetical protein PTKU15_85150 [Paraburkholderia terrae]
MHDYASEGRSRLLFAFGCTEVDVRRREKTPKPATGEIERSVGTDLGLKGIGIQN